VWSILDSFCKSLRGSRASRISRMSFRVFFLVEEIKHLSIPSCRHVLIAATSSASHGIFSSTSHGNFSVRKQALLICVFCFRFYFSFPGSFSLTRGSSLSNCKAANLSVFKKNPVAVCHQYSLGIRAVACFTVLIRNFFAAVVEVRIWFFWEEAAARISVRSLSAGGWNEFPSFGLGGDLKEYLGFRNGSND